MRLGIKTLWLFNTTLLLKNELFGKFWLHHQIVWLGNKPSRFCMREWASNCKLNSWLLNIKNVDTHESKNMQNAKQNDIPTTRHQKLLHISLDPYGIGKEIRMNQKVYCEVFLFWQFKLLSLIFQKRNESNWTTACRAVSSGKEIII